MPKAQRHYIVRQVATLLVRLIAQAADLQLPSDGSPPIGFLPILSGYACRHHYSCRYLTQLHDNLRRHLNKKHALSGSACTPYIHTVKLQGWFSDPRAQYWVVTVAEGGPGAAHQTSSSSGGDSGGGSDNVRRQLEGQEQERLARLGQDCLG